MKTSIYWLSKFDLEYQTFEYWQLTLYGLYFWSRFAVSHPMYMENPIFLEIWENFRGRGQTNGQYGYHLQWYVVIALDCHEQLSY